MSATPQIDAPTRHLYLLKEKEAQYDAGERRPTPGEAAGGERHVRIPYAVLTAGLSPQAVVGYAWLQQHVGDEGCFPSFETLATEMQCSIRAAKARVTELEARRFLAHRRRGLGLSNVYDLYPAGDAPEPKVRRRNPDVQKSARQASEVQKTARPDGQSSVNRSAENCTLTIPSNQTQLTKDAAPTERAAPGPKPAPSKAVGTPGQPTPTVEATPTEQELPARAKRASADAPKPTKFGAVIDAIRAAGVDPVFNRGRDAKAVGECSEPAEEIAAAYVAMRRGEWGTKWLRDKQYLWAVCGDMAAYRSWREGPTKGTDDATEAAAARGPDQAGRPGRAPGVQGATGGTAESKASTAEWIRAQRAQLAALVAPGEGGPVPGVPVRRG